MDSISSPSLLRFVVSQPLGRQLHRLLFYIILSITTASWLRTTTIYISAPRIYVRSSHHHHVRSLPTSIPNRVGSALDASKTRQHCHHVNVASVTNYDHVIILVPAEIEIRRPFPISFIKANFFRSDLFTYSAVSRFFTGGKSGILSNPNNVRWVYIQTLPSSVLTFIMLHRCHCARNRLALVCVMISPYHTMLILLP